MKNLLLLFLVTIALKTSAQQPVYFTTYPALSPDGQTVVFSYEGDLWKASVDDGEATRLTAMQGTEIDPRISPDGKWLAFSSEQLGNYDVYLMPLAGGDIRQLTYHDAADEVDSWSWDSKTIYFTSGRYNSYSAYKVGINGGTATRIFGNYFNFIHQVVEAPDGELYFSDTWESKSQAQRKGYKGPFNPDIQSYDPARKSYKRYTDYIGKDFWTTIDQQGQVYFVSDEGNSEYNLYTFQQGKKTQLTHFDSSIKRPFVAANGKSVVFEKDYQLYLYEVGSGKSRKLTIRISRNKLLEKSRNFDVKDQISAFDVSPDGKKMAFVSRGELFVSDPEGKFVRKLDRGNAERVLEVKWLKDNRTLLFNQTDQGYQNLFTIAADGTGTAKQLTAELRSNRGISLNSKRTSAVYLSGRDQVRLLDLATGKGKTLVTDEIWGLQDEAPTFSPDDAYVLFTAYRNFEEDILVHHIARNETINLTNTGVTETNPAWSPDGRYIFFTSALTKPAYPYGLQDPGVYRMALDLYENPYRSDKLDSLFKEPAKTAKKETKIKADTSKKKPEEKIKPIVINTHRMMDRLERVGPGSGSQMGTYVFSKGEKTFVFYLSNHEGRQAIYRTIYEPFEQPKNEKVADGGSFEPVVANDKYYLLINGSIYTYNIEGNKADKLDIGFTFQRNLEAEFNQMFAETWAGLDENYYDANFHGKNWQQLRDRYAAYVPYVNNRGDLRTLLNDLLGELNSSHVGFATFGSDENKVLNMLSNETGIVFAQASPYTVDSVVANSPAAVKGKNIRPGDVLVRVNGKQVDPATDRDYYFSFPSLQEELTLVLDRKGKKVQVKLHPESSGSFRDQFYDQWIALNRDRVANWGKGRVAYSYMKNMGGGELEIFLRDMEAQGDKDAIILDLRYNTGGNVHDEVLKFLSQRPYLQWQYRGGKMAPQGPFSPAAKPIVLLVNEQSLSDAEMTSAGFKALGLGTIIGNETYHWIIFTSGKGLVDGSFYRLPSWGCFTLDGKDLEHTGVTPDILIKDTFLDKLENKDPQLQKAVDYLLDKLM
ncbi:C-terminal processing protease CtpA/Prc, contains a PDZ domain [bacterium A37T11]|nr:C-terminal processing protease CtpA/Prc, contains a PDZ domain [bacterium A37T11]